MGDSQCYSSKSKWAERECQSLTVTYGVKRYRCQMKDYTSKKTKIEGDFAYKLDITLIPIYIYFLVIERLLVNSWYLP